MIGRRLVTATVVVAAVIGGGVAGALIGIPGTSVASTSGSSSTSTTTKSSDANEGAHERGHGVFGLGAHKDVLDAAAKALNLSTDELLTKLRDGKTTIADIAKDQNVDLQTVIDAMTAVAKSDITDFVNNPLPAPPSFGGGMLGDPGFGFGHRGGGFIENKLDAAAKALGITADELLNDLRDGKSIADIAKAKSVDVNKVIDAIVSDAEAKIDAAVKDKKLTQDQADKLKADLENRITDLVNNTRPTGERHFGFGGGPGFGPGGDPGHWEPDTLQG
jgi:urease gamma subunit